MIDLGSGNQPPTLLSEQESYYLLSLGFEQVNPDRKKSRDKKASSGIVERSMSPYVLVPSNVFSVGTSDVEIP